MATPREIQALADALWAIAQAPRGDWLAHGHRIEAIKLSPVTLRDAVCPQLQASAAKAFARQMPFAQAESETELRGIAMAMSNVLVIGLRAANAGARPAYYATGAER